MRRADLLVVFQTEDVLALEHLLGLCEFGRDDKVGGEGVVEGEVELGGDVLGGQGVGDNLVEVFGVQQGDGVAVQLDEFGIAVIVDQQRGGFAVLGRPGVVVDREELPVRLAEVLRVAFHDS